MAIIGLKETGIFNPLLQGEFPQTSSKSRSICRGFLLPPMRAFRGRTGPILPPVRGSSGRWSYRISFPVCQYNSRKRRGPVEKLFWPVFPGRIHFLRLLFRTGNSPDAVLVLQIRPIRPPANHPRILGIELIPYWLNCSMLLYDNAGPESGNPLVKYLMLLVCPIGYPGDIGWWTHYFGTHARNVNCCRFSALAETFRTQAATLVAACLKPLLSCTYITDLL